SSAGSIARGPRAPSAGFAGASVRIHFRTPPCRVPPRLVSGTPGWSSRSSIVHAPAARGLALAGVLLEDAPRGLRGIPDAGGPRPGDQGQAPADAWISASRAPDWLNAPLSYVPAPPQFDPRTRYQIPPPAGAPVLSSSVVTARLFAMQAWVAIVKFPWLDARMPRLPRTMS